MPKISSSGKKTSSTAKIPKITIRAQRFNTLSSKRESLLNMRCRIISLLKGTCRNCQTAQISSAGKIARFIIIETPRAICTLRCSQVAMQMELTARLIFKMFRVGIWMLLMEIIANWERIVKAARDYYQRVETPQGKDKALTPLWLVVAAIHQITWIFLRSSDIIFITGFAIATRLTM